MYIVEYGTVISTNLNQVEIEWTTPGYDTLQIIAGNHILAYDTIFVPVQVAVSIGLEEVRNEVTARIYPNPFTDNTTIQLNGEIEKGCVMIISDVLGRVVYSKLVTTLITVNSVKTGKGVFQVHLEDKTGNRRFIGKLIAQ